MPMDDLSLSYGGGPAWDAVSAALGQMDAETPGEIERAIRSKARDIAQRARDRVLAEPTHGAKHTGLRARIAAGTTVDDIPSGADITAHLDGQDRPLPLDMDEGGWEHPIFGNRHEWVEQMGYFSWFSDTMDEGEPELEQAVEAVLDEAVSRVQAS